MPNKENSALAILAEVDKHEMNINAQNKGLWTKLLGFVLITICMSSDKFELILRQISRSKKIRASASFISDLQADSESMAFEKNKPAISTSVRYATSVDGNYVLCDLGDPEGNVVQLSKITGEAKLVADKATTEGVYFLRPDGLLPMVKPVFEVNWKSHLKSLRPYINTDDPTFYTLLAYMTYVIAHPKDEEVPYPILVIQGPKGSGKSFFCNYIIRALIDQHSNSSLRLPKKEMDLALQLEHSYLAVYDNLRSFSKPTSDLLAQVATRSYLAHRAHYSQDDLASKLVHGALVLNGIHDFIQEEDLADRCFRVQLEPMDSSILKREPILKKEFSEDLPRIKGALFTLTAKALAGLDECEVNPNDRARIVDFSYWLASVEKVLGFKAGILQRAYVKNVKNIMATSMADDSLTLALKELLEGCSEEGWKSSSSELLEALRNYEKSNNLPGSASILSQRLTSQIAGLNANGICIEIGRGKTRYIKVTKVSATA